MKNRILTFVIGVLVGSIITCIGFLIYSKSMNKNMGFDGRIPMQQMMPSGDIRPFNGEKPQVNGIFRDRLEDSFEG